MSINEMLEKIKPFFYLILILLLCLISFILGRLSGLESRNLAFAGGISNNQAFDTVSITDVSTSSQRLEVSTTSGSVVGSKTSKKYYFPWCGVVKRLKPENQIHFNSIADAKTAGYVAGGNCKGLN